jgi:hypothetical protein
MENFSAFYHESFACLTNSNVWCLQFMLILGENVHARVQKALVLWQLNYGDMESLLSVFVLAKVFYVSHQLSGLGKFYLGYCLLKLTDCQRGQICFITCQLSVISLLSLIAPIKTLGWHTRPVIKS